MGSDLGDSMFSFTASTVPQCRYNGLATIIPFIVGSTLANSGIEINSEKLVNSLPLHNKIKRMVEQKVIKTVLLTQNSIRTNHYVYVSADKGNKKRNKNLAKFIFWYDIDDCDVKTFLLNVDCTDEDTDEIAYTIEHSLQRLFPNDVEVYIYVQCTDSGGSGTLEVLARALRTRGLTTQHYLVASCILHNL